LISQKNSQLEGAWKLVDANSFSEGKVVNHFQVNFTGSQIKVWTKNHFMFVGLFNSDSITTNSYGGGTYKLEGNRYEENILYHTYPDAVGNKVKMLLEIKNDTLIQTWPVNKEGQIDKNKFRIEKYIRAE